ncbi:hypothetical protein M406DRAFT_69286 [Cryphonectria parasitica EP155]|uniref:Uncharacterized protein n=1 Tax=Cryphonectria parasitica (strain ATCC 38755 / EP155) TaxID=660469 RepID=A0A9P4Y557_CRYP1|nr:uncharacterized protein M406DRAFT_69286 [Cryphonectria parasitica EP155]KAF3767122.1 hypothetical protein M406DRAFT_69286 [Cryphonectria parasitica EP155]
MGNINIIATETPVIWVEVHTSGSILSKTRNPPFTITLKAHTDSAKPVTIYTSNTVFDSERVLDQHHLIFRDTKSGELAELPRIDICPPPTAVIQQRYRPKIHQNDSRCRTQSAEDIEARQAAIHAAIFAAVAAHVERDALCQVEKFIVGRTYEIELGENDSQVGWWKKGTIAEVFAYGLLSRRTTKATSIPLKLVNTARFGVVE